MDFKRQAAVLPRQSAVEGPLSLTDNIQPVYEDIVENEASNNFYQRNLDGLLGPHEPKPARSGPFELPNHQDTIPVPAPRIRRQSSPVVPSRVPPPLPPRPNKMQTEFTPKLLRSITDVKSYVSIFSWLFLDDILRIANPKDYF